MLFGEVTGSSLTCAYSDLENLLKMQVPIKQWFWGSPGFRAFSRHLGDPTAPDPGLYFEKHVP